MKIQSKWGSFLALAVGLSTQASAGIITTFTDSLSNADPTQLGRLSRNNLPQDWAGSEPYPGAINLATSYFYTAYSINVGNAPFVQLTFDDAGTSEFVSAYGGSYTAGSFATNWLGDAGSSGNLAGNPAFFQVIVPLNGTLVVVVNNTTGNLTTNHAYTLTVEGFADANFDEPAATPEPASAGLAVTALAALFFFRRRRALPR